MENLSDFIEFRIDTDKRLLYGKWLRDVSYPEYQAGLKQIYQLITRHNINLWLQNSEQLEPRSVEEQKWAAEEFGLLLVQSPVNYLAVVVSSASPHFNVLKALREKAYRIFGKTKYMEIFETEQDALAWLLPNLQYYRLPASVLSV